MVSTLIDAILGQRLTVITLAVVLLVGSLYAFHGLNIEAYPGLMKKHFIQPP